MVSFLYLVGRVKARFYPLYRSHFAVLLIIFAGKAPRIKKAANLLAAFIALYLREDF